MRPDLFERDGLEHLLARAEHEPAASEELDFLADVVAAAELERARLAPHKELADDGPSYLVRPWILAAAASVLFLCALGLWLSGRGQRDDRLLAAREAPRYVATELRTPDEATSAAFMRTMDPYARGDWSAARDTLEGFLQARPDHGPAHFYLAASLEQLAEFEGAEEHYLQAATAPDALLCAHARLRLALLWQRRGESGRARAELEALGDGGGELAQNARALLEALEAR